MLLRREYENKTVIYVFERTMHVRLGPQTFSKVTAIQIFLGRSRCRG